MGIDKTTACLAPLALVSGAVSLPAQFEAYTALTGSPWRGAAIAALVEAGGWTGAVLEGVSLDEDRPVLLPRLLTWSLVGVAVSVNVANGLGSGSAELALALGMSSFVGPAAWAVRTHQRRARTTTARRAARRASLRLVAAVVLHPVRAARRFDSWARGALGEATPVVPPMPSGEDLLVRRLLEEFAGAAIPPIRTVMSLLHVGADRARRVREAALAARGEL